MSAIARCLVALLPFALVAPLPAFAQREHYALDPVHTRVLFAVSHAGFSSALGTVSGTTGTLEFDPGDLASARVEASVPLARLELGDAKWNEAATDLLAVGTYPVATFTTTRVEPVDATHATVIGQLTLHGVAREVKLDVTFNQLRRHPLPPFRRTAGFSATASLSRKDFGITRWPGVIGDVVGLRIEAEAVRARGTVPEPDAAAPSPSAPTDETDDVAPPVEPPAPPAASTPPATP